MDRRREERATAMYLLTMELGDASTWDDIARISENHVDRVFQAEGTLLHPGQTANWRATRWKRSSGPPAGPSITAIRPAVSRHAAHERGYVPAAADHGRRTGACCACAGARRRRRRSTKRMLLESFQRHIALVVDRQRLPRRPENQQPHPGGIGALEPIAVAVRSRTNSAPPIARHPERPPTNSAARRPPGRCEPPSWPRFAKPASASTAWSATFST